MNHKAKHLIMTLSIWIWAGLFLFSQNSVVYAQSCPPKAAKCGDIFLPSCNDTCNCPGAPQKEINSTTKCCGWLDGTDCLAAEPSPTVTTPPAVSPNPNPNPAQNPGLYAGATVDATTLKKLNPLIKFSTKTGEFFDSGKNNFVLANFLNHLLDYIFPLASLALFLMIVWGGFEMLTGAASKKNLDTGKQRVTTALIGFILLFSAYWITQIVQYITGVVIFN